MGAYLGILDRRSLIESDRNEGLCIRQQFDLSGLPCSTYYYEPIRCSDRDIAIIRSAGQIVSGTTFLGYRQLASHLECCFQQIIFRLTRKSTPFAAIMAIETLCPRRDLSRRNPGRRVFPYLLLCVPIVYKWQVYNADITYIPMAKGFMCLPRNSSPSFSAIR